jgi:DNA-directed RNA polymerase subunit RPC12/RpoP
MPLRKELRHLYGAAWKKFRAKIIAERGNACEDCGRTHPRINGSHDDHNSKNNRLVKLRCPSCHARHDAPHCYAMFRRRRARENGQQWLTPELEWSPYQQWEIPGPIFDRITQIKIGE